ncbi:MAG: hypothetical protein US94_C0027G0014 [Berkelbacteria bacterium GW2011_GWB1_38_5]|uniref:Transcriptional repressor PaaX-like central Cas2-like domain-containing protein n=2 Tax=Candidatus Berkelbacteria TaxID=1618330 RepID=A0A0G0IQJ0_9BACT|nr:MAG: hypothetical protein US31_C0006G0012 [Berkelbacteria bacterium GW2011_GWA1_36_9]KKQ73736.1 MAG: hypothetical protein US94_C0027G0014 [Berkelbacteria bacterium GW2011_GWB1_38_5]
MKIYKQDLEIVKLTSKEILLSLFDITTPFFLASRIYRKSINKYLEQREIDRSNFLYHLKYLQRKKYIQIVVENKEKYIELTPKGIKHSNILKINTLIIKRIAKWDQKWRVVIFDVPEKLHYNRDLFRDSLKRMGFIQIQKSVYAYPFECTKEITFLSEILNIKKYVTTMISEIIQGEDRIIEYFLKENILQSNDLKIK